MEVMRGLVRDEMSAGALGIGSSLIYPPAFFASTEELIEFCRAASPYGGAYISHMRDEGRALIESVEELTRISREGGVPAEIYHLKAAGRDNWPKMDAVIEMVERARAAGEPISADMYVYTGRRHRSLEFNSAALSRRRAAEAVRTARRSGDRPE